MQFVQFYSKIEIKESFIKNLMEKCIKLIVFPVANLIFPVAIQSITENMIRRKMSPEK